jgi:hypothetical protein
MGRVGGEGECDRFAFLFADATAESTSVWELVQQHRAAFLSRRSAEQFLGFADNQKQRITGEKGRGSKGQRPEYIGLFGYDTKAAMHCLRLYLECIELMEEGTITLPRPERNYLIEVRSGGWPLEKFLEEAAALHIRAATAAEQSTLPETVDVAEINRIVTMAHMRQWDLVRR